MARSADIRTRTERKRRPPRTAAFLAAAGLFGAAPLGACVQSEPLPAFKAVGPQADPLSFFLGRQTSWGLLETSGGAPSRPFRVEGAGRTLPDGSLELDQAIHWEGGKVDHRQWRLVRRGVDRFEGTLTDASGPVVLETYGRLMHVAYPMKIAPGARMEQWIYLQDDGRTVLNEAVVRLLGVQIARISEIIHSQSPPAPE